MQKLSVYDIPEDYRYYRSGFFTYADYTENVFKRIRKSDVGETGFFGWISRFFFGFFSIAKFLKTPIVPTIEQIHEVGGRHGIVYWSPWGTSAISRTSQKQEVQGRNIFVKGAYGSVSDGTTNFSEEEIRSFSEVPEGNLDGWKKLSPTGARGFHHAGRSAFSVLDTEEYWKKWSSNARNHLKQIKRNTQIRIETVSMDDWLKVYKKTELPHRLKGYHSSVLQKMSALHGDKLRIVLASIDDTPLAGAVFLDEMPTSVYLVAFQNPAAKPHHLGLALIDWWFADSLKKGYKYLDFDHMWSPGDPDSYRGYTQFKSELADYEVEFDEVWWRWF